MWPKQVFQVLDFQLLRIWRCTPTKQPGWRAGSGKLEILGTIQTIFCVKVWQSFFSFCASVFFFQPIWLFSVFWPDSLDGYTLKIQLWKIEWLRQIWSWWIFCGHQHDSPVLQKDVFHAHSEAPGNWEQKATVHLSLDQELNRWEGYASAVSRNDLRNTTWIHWTMFTFIQHFGGSSEEGNHENPWRYGTCAGQVSLQTPLFIKAIFSIAQ